MCMHLLKKILKVPVILWTFMIAAYASGQNICDSTLSVLILDCEVPGLSVWINGTRAGNTPVPPLPFPPGRIHARVSHFDPLDWLSRDWERDIDLLAGDTLTVRVTFNKTFWITSDPPGAVVDGPHGVLGITPVQVELKNGPLQIEVSKAGYRDIRIELSDTGSRMVNLVMEKWPPFQVQKKPAIHKAWIIGSGVMALAAGISGYVLKERADESYDRYLRSGKPSDMERYFNDTVRSDRWSGLLYGVGEGVFLISLTFLIYGYWKQE